MRCLAFYLTRAGWAPTQPLTWGDLVPITTFTNVDPTNFTRWSITLPQRSGRHVLYMIWQRTFYSQEAFYSCSDVDFGGGTTPTPTPTPTSTVTPTPTPTATPTATPGGTWTAGAAYRPGDGVTYAGAHYTCRQAHTALPGWEPATTPALWQKG
ncbi:hypothetical protein GCM10027589_13430 [Actinocorallia lasiicapitis]